VLRIGYLCERLFGERYLALAYGNLVLALLMLFVTFALLRRAYGPSLASLAASVLCAAVPLQHGILWYNSVGTAALVVVLLLAARRLGGDGAEAMDVPLQLAGVWVLGMVKANAFAIGIVVAALTAVGVAVRRASLRGFVSEVLALAVAVALVPIGEGWLCGCTPTAWWNDLVIRPAGRIAFVSHVLSDVATLGAFLSNGNDAYLGGWDHDMVGGTLAALAALTVGVARGARGRARWLTVMGAATGGVLALAYAVSNSDIVFLRKAPLLTTLLAVPIVAGLRHPHPRWVRATVAGCLGWWAIAAGTSVAAHARLRYGYFPSARFRPASPDWPSRYFDGVALGRRQWSQTDGVYRFLASERPGRADGGFFGPSLGYFYRLTGTLPPRGLPLWWDHGVSWSPRDESALLTAFRDADPPFVVYNLWALFELPAAIRDEVAARYTWVHDDPQIWVRETTPAAAARDH